MRRLCTLVIVFAFLFLVGALLAQTASTSCSNPAKIVNPVKPSAESLAQGKKYYGYDCAMCHGATGNGKGDVETADKLPDFTNEAAMKDMSDGEMFCALKTGKGHMPLERVRVSENELWNLVNYVRSLSK